MLGQFVQALPGMLAPALLVMAMSVLLTVGEGRDKPMSRNWRLYGLFMGILAALVFTVLRSLVIVNRRSGVNLPVLIGVVACDVLMIPIVFGARGLTAGWHEHPVRLHAANAVSALDIALTSFFALQDVIMQLTNFVEAGKSPFTSDMLLRALGWVLGVCLAVVCAAIFRTLRSTAYHASFVTACVLLVVFMLVRHLAQLFSLLMSMLLVVLHGSAFRVLILVSNNDLALTIAQSVVFLVPALASIVAGFRQRSEGPNPAVRREHIAFRRRAFAAGAWSLVAVIAVTVSLTVGVAHAHREPTLSPPEPYSLKAGVARIPFPEVDDGHLHRFAYTAKDGTRMRFIVIKKNGGAYGAGLDACETCGDAGYYEKNGKIICKRCGVQMNVATIGFKGGCNPIPFSYTTSHGYITIHTGDLDALSSHFKE